ncbi:MAG: hypothetical protein ACTTH0_01615 [Eubacteriales bacterium]
MEITLTLRDVVFLTISVFAIVLIGYCIGLVKNLIITVKRTNYILEDAMSISKIAADRTQEVNDKVTDMVKNITKVVSEVKTKEPKNSKVERSGEES